ncbi:hypothetical protein GCM10017621_33080 [Maricaulis virginensis]|uniref:Uncharacterized protein n=1 Tax=Maricaulis virginensis TaxID=144022 RepID=A0A9W6MPN1_9PROT|nr:hypothetical protein GCM10017621_33080 [Maricaulis virginensis]
MAEQFNNHLAIAHGEQAAQIGTLDNTGAHGRIQPLAGRDQKTASQLGLDVGRGLGNASLPLRHAGLADPKLLRQRILF